MEMRVRERLVGALILVAGVVLLVPAILTGRGSAPTEPPAQPMRREEFQVIDAAESPDEQVLVPEPVADAPRPAAKEESAPLVGANAGAPAKAAPAASTALPAPAAKAPARDTSPQQTPAETTPPAWAVQLGAFSNRQKAEQLVAELRKRRFPAFLFEYRASGEVLYRVRVGPEQDRARAEEIAARLAKDGFQPVVARHP